MPEAWAVQLAGGTDGTITNLATGTTAATPSGDC
jgi:hypothetical protein